ncbi:MAG: helix-turn-helix transcriptional regulator [Gemmatimonadaceae bacterium]
MKPADAKLQRWIDLLAALLRARYGVTLDELQGEVPAYGRDASRETIERMFERDKDELRALGIPIRVLDEDAEEGEVKRYTVRAREMYLPYLALVSSAPATKAKIPPAGYRDVPSLSFEPDELSALLRAARGARSVGDPTLARDAESAIRKLTHDLGLPLGAVIGESDETPAPSSDGRSVPAVATLGAALLRNKRVHFIYHSMNRDATQARDVEPYGLFFSSGHWYLAARDTALGGVRNFRVSRMTDVSVNEKKPQSADYEIPRDFSLAAHARAKEPWEIGNDAPEDMIVEFRGETGATMAARALGTPVAGDATHRSFQVRRIDSFVRWLMSFAGEIVPVSPPRLREQYDAAIAVTLARYSA